MTLTIYHWKFTNKAVRFFGTILNCGAKVRFFMKTTNFTSKIFIVYTKMIISNRKYKELFS